MKCVNFIEVKNCKYVTSGSCEFSEFISSVRNCNLNFGSIVNNIFSGG